MSFQQTTTHEALMAQFKDRLDQAAFEQLVCDYALPAAAVARQLLADQALAEDAVQEAFVRIIKNRKRYVKSSSFSCWFYTILRNVCIDMLRKRERQRGLTKRLSEQITSSTRTGLLSDCSILLETLPSGERSVLELRVVHSMSFKEIASALDISEEAAKKRAQRGLRKLRRKVSQTEYLQRQAI